MGGCSSKGRAASRPAREHAASRPPPAAAHGAQLERELLAAELQTLARRLQQFSGAARRRRADVPEDFLSSPLQPTLRERRESYFLRAAVEQASALEHSIIASVQPAGRAATRPLHAPPRHAGGGGARAAWEAAGGRGASHACDGAEDAPGWRGCTWSAPSHRACLPAAAAGKPGFPSWVSSPDVTSRVPPPALRSRTLAEVADELRAARGDPDVEGALGHLPLGGMHEAAGRDVSSSSGVTFGVGNSSSGISRRVTREHELAQENEALRQRIQQLEHAMGIHQRPMANGSPPIGMISPVGGRAVVSDTPHGNAYRGTPALFTELPSTPWVWTSTPTGGRVLTLD
ncbi:hypothetical protein AB1Y20_005119 [Prymnesium parvum]|uniref:Uncharacterized protein n=1 Tax=Prymnesium parvum TaxID=97485 RepID=A0AB34J3E1_PRYPA